MSELQEVLRAIEERSARGDRMALATLVAVRGSTYRREGARLLVPEHGAPVGTISGGCLEGDVRAAADDVMKDGRPRLLRFDLTADDEVVWGWGLGCNGVIDVFVEPAPSAVMTAGAIRRAIEEQRPLAGVVVVEAPEGGPAPPGARLLVHPDGRCDGSFGEAALDERAGAAAVAALRDEASRLVDLGQGVRAFVEAIVPPPRLLVCGAGHDAIPMVRAAAGLGWQVEVIDDRDPFLDPHRFPGAARMVRADPAQAARAAGVDDRTYVVVMSHNFLRDKDYLRAFLGTGVPYLGMLGPRARLDRLLAQLEREGVRPSPDDMAALHGPAGLDLGGDGPDEVAWAIVGEVMAVRNGRGGGFLKDRTGPIHDRPGAGHSVSPVA